MIINSASGRGVALRGDDIDTDRIMPARFLRAVTFEGLETHLFEDDRKQDPKHVWNDPHTKGTAILVVNKNFGCGSSREHAPQAIARWGVKAIVGVSFAEIFFGNSLMIGLPCATVTEAEIERLMAAIEADPTVTCRVDLVAGTIAAGNVSVPLGMPDAIRAALRSGDWDATSLLVDRYEDVERTAAALPYVSGWR